MAMNLGIGDIVKGLELALLLYQYGFVKENAAHTRYNEFRKDILNFHNLLEKLDEALCNAQHRYDHRGRPALGTRFYEPLSRELEAERITIIGDFQATLNDCKTLLDSLKQAQHGSNNPIQNLWFQLSQQEARMNDLRRRIHFHSEKIRLVLDRLSIELLTDQDAKIDVILALAEKNFQVSTEIKQELDQLQQALYGHAPLRRTPVESATTDLHVVGETLAQKFQEHFYDNAPPDIDGGIPISQGFDALLLHFEGSNDESLQATERYLSFLKARWLISRIKTSDDYEYARPGYYYKRAVNQIDYAIWKRVHQPAQLTAYPETTLLNLPEASFRIWPPPSISSSKEDQQHPLGPRAGEEEILSMELAPDGPNRSDAVTILKGEEGHFRIILKTTLASAPNDKILVPLSVHSHEDKLIPRYLLPTMATPILEMALFARNEETLFKFKSFDDLKRFQLALTGHRVAHDQSNIDCQFPKDVGLPVCTGRIQLWQVPIVANSTTAVNSLTHPSAPPGPDTSSNGQASRRDSVATARTPTNTINEVVGEGWEADRIKLPSLVIFTQIAESKKRRRFVIAYLKLVPGIAIDTNACDCSTPDNTCKTIILKKRKKLSTVRILRSEVAAQGQPNPNTFDIFPFRHGSPSASSTTSTVQTEDLMLTFQTVPEKEEFAKELRLRLKIRDRQIRNQLDFANKVRELQDRPQLLEAFLAEYRANGTLPSGNPARKSLPPHVDLPDSGPAFAATLAHALDADESGDEENDKDHEKRVSAPAETTRVPEQRVQQRFTNPLRRRQSEGVRRDSEPASVRSRASTTRLEPPVPPVPTMKAEKVKEKDNADRGASMMKGIRRAMRNM